MIKILVLDSLGQFKGKKGLKENPQPFTENKLEERLSAHKEKCKGRSSSCFSGLVPNAADRRSRY